jgi:phosphoglycerate dehydrogenase-like enzyme
VTERSRVVVMGATAESPPPGIGVVAEAVELAFADSEAELAAALPGTDVLFAWHPRSALLEPVWERAGDLRWIQSASAGVDGLLFPKLVQSDVVVTNARGVFDEAMAEYVLGLLLVFAKGFRGVLEDQRRKRWRPRDAELLSGKGLLVVGVGSIGRAIGRVCEAVGMRVRGVGTIPREDDDVFETVLGVDDLARACSWADVVVGVLPAIPTTRHLFDETAFAAMRPSARFVNVGRGSTVDERALAEALASGRLAGAAIDVFEEEPLPQDSPLWEMPNVVVSPHASANFAGWRETLVELFVENLQRYVSGRPLRNVVDKARGYVPG